MLPSDMRLRMDTKRCFNNKILISDGTLKLRFNHKVNMVIPAHEGEQRCILKGNVENHLDKSKDTSFYAECQKK